jgi:hypothetical protein
MKEKAVEDGEGKEMKMGEERKRASEVRGQ